MSNDLVLPENDDTGLEAAPLVLPDADDGMDVSFQSGAVLVDPKLQRKAVAKKRSQPKAAAKAKAKAAVGAKTTSKASGSKRKKTGTAYDVPPLIHDAAQKPQAGEDYKSVLQNIRGQ